ncbi:inositol-tetrakisphosphate 1-kinase isoform X5 [Calonectris borealis]|uniref:inositol-tetrakisphosphate 1-kinase isoform X5 n=1 Tax=Calonectris borealis TaxID=1323832 RepID=UPI003F4C464F
MNPSSYKGTCCCTSPSAIASCAAKPTQQEFQLQLSQQACGATHCLVLGLPHAVLRGTKGREKHVNVVSRPGVAGFFPMKDSTNLAAFNLKAAFKHIKGRWISSRFCTAQEYLLSAAWPRIQRTYSCKWFDPPIHKILDQILKLDLTKPIEDQGPLDVIIHKLTDVILEADQNDSQSLELVHRFQEYIDAHPETIILDPLPAIRTLLDRSKSYELIRQIEAYMQDERICSPPFMELTSACGEDTLQLIEKNGLAFPFICKTRVAHGTNSHEMAIIFNQEGLKAVRPPCVIQSFINHNAVLYKVFVVGESYTVVKRPSLKNFSAGISGYEGVSEFFTDLLNHIAAVLQGQAPEVTQLNRSKLLAEQTSGIMDERICCASTGCLSVMGKDSSWIVESETNSSVKLQHQRLGCNSAVSPSFQQHCVATLATKASSQ